MLLRILLPVLVLTLSCSQIVPLATLDASITPRDDLTGGSSLRAFINFTSFNQPPGPSGNDSRLRLRFSNVDGAEMTFVLSPTAGGFSPGDYQIDGSANTFDASFTAMAGGMQTPFNLSSRQGFIKILSAALDSSGALLHFTGEFHVNFEGGGAGVGSIGVTVQ